MKVVLIDNFNREEVSDILLKANLTEEEATEEAEKYNRGHSFGPCEWFAVVKEDEYEL